VMQGSVGHRIAVTSLTTTLTKPSAFDF